MVQKINWDYLSLYKEMPFIFSTYFIKKEKFTKKTRNILIVNPCVVGEFVASLPALRMFIKKNKNCKIDIMVSPLLEPLAKRIKGIRKVYFAESVYSRKEESSKKEKQEFGSYDLVLVMRMSKNSRSLLKHINYQKLKTSLKPMAKYALHLLNCNLKGTQPKSWREINFEIVGEKITEVSLEEILEFNRKDYSKIDALNELKTKDKIILIHTGPAWIMKRWENQKWAGLIRKINSLGGYRFIFVGAGNAKKDFEEISKKLDFTIYSIINKISLLELLLVMKKSGYFIGIDSGPRNMAHLSNLRSITLLGPSGRQFMPSNKKDIIIDKTNGWNIYETFFYKKNRFINKIKPDEVFQAFKKLSASEKREDETE